MESEIKYADGLINMRWTEEDIEFLIQNASHLNHRQIAQQLGRTTSVVRKKLESLGLGHSVVGEQPQIPDLEYVPDGMTQQRAIGGTGGMIYRIPSSTPGILARVIHRSGLHSENEVRHAS